VLIEDLISTGTSSINAAVALVESGAELLGVTAIFTYGLDVAADRFEQAQIPWAALTTFDALMSDALAAGSLTPSDKAILSDWRKDPAAWSQARGGAG
jgi:orotate phosphoribosyltransferase